MACTSASVGSAMALVLGTARGRRRRGSGRPRSGRTPACRPGASRCQLASAGAAARQMDVRQDQSLCSVSPAKARPRRGAPCCGRRRSRSASRSRQSRRVRRLAQDRRSRRRRAVKAVTSTWRSTATPSGQCRRAAARFPTAAASARRDRGSRRPRDRRARSGLPPAMMLARRRPCPAATNASPQPARSSSSRVRLQTTSALDLSVRCAALSTIGPRRRSARARPPWSVRPVRRRRSTSGFSNASLLENRSADTAAAKRLDVILKAARACFGNSPVRFELLNSARFAPTCAVRKPDGLPEGGPRQTTVPSRPSRSARASRESHKQGARGDHRRQRKYAFADRAPGMPSYFQHC